jgi:hypothetical protein
MIIGVVKMDKKKYGVHASHCCVMHGCKYGDEDCPVVNKEIKQEFICESCGYQGFKKVEHINEYLDYQQKIKEAKENGVETISISVDFLDRMLNNEPEF